MRSLRWEKPYTPDAIVFDDDLICAYRTNPALAGLFVYHVGISRDLSQFNGARLPIGRRAPDY